MKKNLSKCVNLLEISFNLPGTMHTAVIVSTIQPHFYTCGCIVECGYAVKCGCARALKCGCTVECGCMVECGCTVECGCYYFYAVAGTLWGPPWLRGCSWCRPFLRVCSCCSSLPPTWRSSYCQLGTDDRLVKGIKVFCYCFTTVKV